MVDDFHPINRSQANWILPGLEDWLGKDHRTRFILDAVEPMDLKGFDWGCRKDDCGNISNHSQIMMALLLYAYCHCMTSRRQIERLYQMNIACRPISARMGMVALEDTKIKSNAYRAFNLTKEGPKKRKIKRMIQTADAEDKAGGELDDKGSQSDEWQGKWQNRQQGREWFNPCLDRLNHKEALAENPQLDQAKPRQSQGEKQGQLLRSCNSKADVPEKDENRNAHLTDPDSGIFKARDGIVQGYRDLAVVSEDPLILVADQVDDRGLLHPMIRPTQINIAAADWSEAIDRAMVNARFCNEVDLCQVSAVGPALNVASWTASKESRQKKEAPPLYRRIPSDMAATAWWVRKLSIQAGRALYKFYSETGELKLSQIKWGLDINRFSRWFMEMCLGKWLLISTVGMRLLLFHSCQARFGVYKGIVSLLFTDAGLALMTRKLPTVNMV